MGSSPPGGARTTQPRPRPPVGARHKRADGKVRVYDLSVAETTEAGMPEEGWRRTFDQVMKTWIQPEIDRRDAAGLLPAAFRLRAAQVILPNGAPPFVRLNDEVIAVLVGPPSAA